MAGTATMDPWDCLLSRSSSAARKTTELFLSHKGGTYLSESFATFENLQVLWLNNNRLRSLQALDHSVRLKELYINDNLLTTLHGPVSKCKFLEVLSAANNQIKNLSSQLEALRRLRCLQTVVLAGNPIADEPDYRERIISRLPALEILDHRKITNLERHHPSACEVRAQSTGPPGSLSGPRRAGVQDGSGRSSLAPRRGSHVSLRAGTGSGRSSSHLPERALPRSSSSRAAAVVPSGTDMQKVSEGQTREDGHLPQPKTHPSRTRKLFGFSTLEWDVLNKARILEARQKGGTHDAATFLLEDELLRSASCFATRQAIRVHELHPSIGNGQAQTRVCPGASIHSGNESASVRAGLRALHRECDVNPPVASTASAAVSDTSATRGRDYTQTASAKCAPAATLLCGADVAPFEVWEEEKVRGACLDMLSRVAPGQERRRPPNGLLFDISLNVLPCLAEFFENDGLGIGKVPLRLSADVAGLKEEIARRAAATQPHTEAEAHLLTAVSSGPPSNPSASSNRPRTGKTSGEAPHPAAGNRGGVSPGASDSTGPPAQDSACASIALAVSNEKAAAELCLQNAGAAATPSVAALLSSERELSVTQVIEWLLHRPWVRREDTHVKHDVDKLYADAQAQLAHGKDAEAATTAAAAIRLARILEGRQAAKTGEADEGDSKLSKLKKRKADFFW